MTTLEQSRVCRLRQLEADIIKIRDRIERCQDDERLLIRIEKDSPARRAEIHQLQEERHRLDAALFNLVKEVRELSR
jgi:hypothetical protein